ncbi:tRNA pseudouridine(38-40) synthase TruA [Spiroplasma platyhelix]|uniref:tRNA pseudouridine synthase A n=1 Tax=Spiroplasma platyhelix PALS-1 TaxID=1276218 RepID=A0A846TT48_9MOLU|nr:tRNA pseudouridine(38-40) synthase TruA [Spiroplasma platyhelix]MBE4704313.1 tRNA pseudouridine synthase A [Spiroplasma platyhelix PALS-1]NKE38685.1 tRNA pseudouridine(38-40) synthase TruA [Spiroplasma platyhelix PALS-1]UJB28897.1 tRNA pseudouridine synthase A [Spiroplasma platyhelix PALS-1]
MKNNLNSSSVKMKKPTTYCVRVAYDGSHFSGWAKQIGLRTVEGEINKILRAIFQVEIAINGASRTDSGVHGYDQVFTFALPFWMEPNNLKVILEQHFTRDIKIKNVTVVANKYDIRKHVRYKEYRYYINTGAHNPFKINYQLQYCKKISLKKLRKALKLFTGRNYFYNFSGLAKGDAKNPYRRIDKIRVWQRKGQLTIVVKAKGFVRYQIRYIIGAALDYSQDKVTLDEIKQYLSAKEKEKYPYPKASASGLYLYKIVLN